MLAPYTGAVLALQSHAPYQWSMTANTPDEPMSTPPQRGNSPRSTRTQYLVGDLRQRPDLAKLTPDFAPGIARILAHEHLAVMTQVSSRSGLAICVAKVQMGVLGTMGRGRLPGAAAVLRALYCTRLPAAPSPFATNTTLGSSAFRVMARQ